MEWILVTNPEDPQDCWEWQCQQKYCLCGLKGTEEERNEKRLLGFQNPTGRKWGSNTTRLKTRAALREQRWLWGQSLGPGSCGLQTQIILMSWNPKWPGTSDLLSFPLFSPHLNRSVCIDYSTPILPVYLGNRKLLVSHSTEGEVICPRMDYIQSHTHRWLKWWELYLLMW